jgi:transcriptional regulator with XRE-family HTH domain
MLSSDLIRMARDRAGLTQEQLAARSGRPRSTIARWESGAREPSLDHLSEVIRAAGLDLAIDLANRDESLAENVRDQLRLTPEKRLGRLLPRAEVGEVEHALAAVAQLRTSVILIGPLAAALQGSPQRPRDSAAEIVPADRGQALDELEAMDAEASDDEERFAERDRRWRWLLPDGGAVVVIDRISGSGDFADLRRDAVHLELFAHALMVASPRDLLRLADASPRPADRAYRAGLRTLLEVTRESA